MSYNGGNNQEGSNKNYNNRNPRQRPNRDARSESYGVFDETSFVTQSISIPGFKKAEVERKPSERSEPRNDRQFNDRQSEPRFEPRNSEPRNFEPRSERNSEQRFEPRRQQSFTNPRPTSNVNPVNARPAAPQTRPMPATPPAPRNFFVFDIETIPCIETARTFLNLGSEVSDEEVVAKLTAYHSQATGGQNEFFRQLFHKVVCISFIAGTIFPLKGGKEKYTIKTIRSGGRKGESEEEILREIFAYLNKHPSRLISFNGRGFDLPVLQYRAMKYGIDARWIYNDGYYNYNHRYSIEKHCDLLEMFSNYGASARVKMAEVAALFKLPCKNNGVDGSQVYTLYKEGKLEEIADYCEADVITTYILYLRFMQHSGKLSQEGYNIVIDNLLKMLKDEQSPAHHVLFAEQFLAMNNGDVHIKTHQPENSEQKTEDASDSEALEVDAKEVLLETEAETEEVASEEEPEITETEAEDEEDKALEEEPKA